METEPNTKTLFTLAPEAIAAQITDSLIQAGKDYLQRNPGLNPSIAEGITRHALMKGMTVEESALAIGPLVPYDDQQGSIKYRYPSEGLELRFDPEGKLQSVVEQ